MVLVDVELTGENFDGNGQRTIAYYTVDGTNTFTETGFGAIDYAEYYVYINEYFNRGGGYPAYTSFSEFRYTQRAYFIFTGITIPVGSLIQDATLSFRMSVDNATYQTITGTVYGRKTASPVTYSTTGGGGAAQSLFTKPVATAKGTFQISYNYPTATQLQPKQSDITAVVQELVNAFDYDNDNMMFMIQQPSLRNLVPPASVSPAVNATNEVYMDGYGTGNEPFTNLTINFLLNAQDCKPISDISNAGAWEDTTFGNSDTELWDELDEEIPDSETTAVRSPTKPTIADTFEVKLDNCVDPISSDQHTIHITARGNGNRVKAQLFQGAVLIAESPDFVLTEFFVDRTYVLSAGEADAITDYNDLRIRVVPSEVP